MPCLPCLIDKKERQSTIQHVTEGGRRLGHQYTYPSCPWHHQGIPENGMSGQQMTGLLGPSFAKGRKAFEEWYGDERYVLVPTADFMLECSAWNLETPYTVRNRWEKLYLANR